MNEQMRIQKLAEIKENEENKYQTGIRIRYKGEVKIFDVHKIPLEYLVYNKYNGRIGTLVKSYEKQNHAIDPEKIEHKKIIEEFLWESKPDRNKITMKSLVSDGQRQYGIVSRNGVIIDGNRRASLLNKIYDARDNWDANVSHCKYFNAIILPDEAGKKEILELETIYQMGLDEKLDYNPIEKYLKCADLRDAGFTESEMAAMMNRKEVEVKKILEIYSLMNEYLDEYDYSGIYTLLEGREGQFVDLNGYLLRFYERKAFADWNFKNDNISDLKLICFDYIRAKYEGKEFRNIANTNKNNIDSFFASGKIWGEFSEKHFEIVKQVREKSVEEIRRENPGHDLSKLLDNRDADWKRQLKGALQGNLNISSSKLEDIKGSNQPANLLAKAKNTLELVDSSVENFCTDETVAELVKDISKIVWEFKKKIDRGNRE